MSETQTQKSKSLYSNHPQNTVYLDDVQELHRRINKLRPFALFKAEDGFYECREIKKVTNFKDTYMWNKEPLDNVIGYVHDPKQHITVCGKPNAQGSRPTTHNSKVYITLHWYGYQGFFKPDLLEVASQLPASLFDEYEEIYVTTEPLSNEVNLLTGYDGGVHIGRTTVVVPK